MARVRIKFCGITRPEDAESAVALGVDALGFVFHAPSPRAVEPGRAAAIVRSLPPFVTSVGLFVNAPPEQVRRVADETGIAVIQYHGDESPEDCAAGPPAWIKAVRVRAAADVVQAAERFAGARALLLDTWDPQVYGGSGKRFDWDLVPAERPRPVILAGGLDAGNVAGAIRRVQPWAVDVSGGIERDKGVKDAGRMREFVEEVRRSEC